MPCYQKNMKALQTFKQTIPLVKRYENSNRASSYAFLNAFPKGSLTVEAAVVLPLFFLAMVTLICIMDLLRIQAQTSITLNETAKELGMYAHMQRQEEGTDEGIRIVDQAICIQYVQTKLKKEPNAKISMLGSTYKNHRIVLRASGTYRFPISFFPVNKIAFKNQVKVHAWTGYGGEQEGYAEEDGTNMVYIADRQTVYHTYSDCTYIEPSIDQISYDQVDEERNTYGGKYYACPHCISDSNLLEQVYIAESGDRYHSSQYCQSLKRTVHLVEQSQVAHLNVCKRCSQRP